MNIGADDIFSGDQKLTLGLVWEVMLKYQVRVDLLSTVELAHTGSCLGVADRRRCELMSDVTNYSDDVCQSHTIMMMSLLIDDLII